MQSCAQQDEIDAETAVILQQVPIGTPSSELPGAMQRLGFACRESGPDLACERAERDLLVCTRRTRVILLPLEGRLVNVLVNVGRFC